MILPDTSVWIEFLRQRQPLTAEFERLLSEHRLVAASPVFGELLQGTRDDTEREGLALSLGTDAIFNF